MKSRYAASTQLLRRIARWHGIQLAYTDVAGKIRHSSQETLRRLLHAMGVTGLDGNLSELCNRLWQEHWAHPIEPVSVVWDGDPPHVQVRVPLSRHDKTIECRLELEDGQKLRWIQDLTNARRVESITIAGRAFEKLILPLPTIDIGFHRLCVRVADCENQSLVISAPKRCYENSGRKRAWGLFLPMYACRSDQSWGAGNLSDWAEFCQWVGSLGGTIAGTLPLGPAFLQKPLEPSPYSPVSRLFWNEFYIDPLRAPEFSRCRAAQKIVAGAEKEINALRRERFVHYGREMHLKRKVLESLVGYLLAGDSDRRRQFARFERQETEISRYAAFRAAQEQTGASWPAWPERLQGGNLRRGDYAENTRYYHLYVQWLARAQMEDLLARCDAAHVKFYLDLPLGVNPDGYDIWRFRDNFVHGVSVGAPPDSFFTKGQDWGFPPLHPQRARHKMYDYMLQVVRFQMRNTGLLRLDHVMGLHRLYWVPQGMPPSEGAYVSYPAEELYALLSVESHRNQTVLVGENLGTVPAEVNRQMRRRRLRHMFVMQYELQPKPEALRPPPRESLASLNTHDMPPFAAFWNGLDIADRAELGLIPLEKLPAERQRRENLKRSFIAFLRRKGFLPKIKPGPGDLLKASLSFLAASDAEMVLVNLEDLWLETEPQNVPGTNQQRPNWKRKARWSLEKAKRSPAIAQLLTLLNELRAGAPAATASSARQHTI